MRKNTFLWVVGLLVGALFSLNAQTLKHSYTFEDGTANDVVGTVHGTLNGTPTIANGVFTSATNGDFIQFDGAALALNTYTAITTEAYIKAGAGTNPSWTVFAYFGAGSGTNAYLMTIARGDNVSRTEFVGGGIVNGPELEDGKLHHLVSVLSADSLWYYIDGKRIGAVKNTKALSTIATNNAWLCKGGWPDATWNGSIYEYNVYEGTMDAATVKANADNFLGKSSSSLAGITSTEGQLVPAFNALTTDYALVVGNDADTLTVGATPAYSIQNVSGAGQVVLVNGKATVNITVLSKDSTSTTTYNVYVSKNDTSCLTPLYALPNLAKDKYMTDLSKYGGWGGKSLAFEPANVYCGYSSGKVVKLGSIDNPLTGIMQANKTYRVKAMVKTSVGAEFQIGVFGWSAGQGDINNKIQTNGEWKALDFTFSTGATLGGNTGLFFNNWACIGADVASSIGYIDNWEVYDITNVDDRLKSLTLSTGTLKPAFSPDVTSYKVELPLGTKSVQVAATSFVPGNYMAGLDSADLATGLDTVKIKITSKDSLHSKTYTVYFRALTMKHSYTFEEGAYTDTTVIDMVGTLNGKRNGAKLTIANGAATVSGSTSSTSGYISFDGVALALNKYSAITLEGYVKAGKAENVNKYTMLGYFGSTTAGRNCLWQQLTRGNSSIAFTETNNGSATVTVEGPELDDGAKHHVVSMLTADSIYFYIDGKLKQKKALSNTNFITNIGTGFASLFKGVWNDNNWNGSIYEYNIYDGIMDPATIAAKADAFVAPTVSTLSSITPSVGVLNPAFDPSIKEYAIELADSAIFTIAATPTYNVATVTGTGEVDASSGKATATIHVVSQDSSTVTDYKVFAAVKDTTCFVPLYSTGNLITDPQMTDLSKYAGWGSKSINVNPIFVYCGQTSAKITGKCGGSLDFNLTPVIAGNRTYRVKAMVSTNGTGEAKIGISGATPALITKPFKTGANEWQVLEFTFTTQATISSATMYLNSCESQNATESYIDNYELYDITEFDTHLSNIALSKGTLKPAFNPAVTEYRVSLPEGIDSLTVTPTVVVPQAVVTGGGKIGLDGIDTVSIKVKSVNGLDSLTYNVYVQTLIRKHSYTFEAATVTDTTIIDVVGDLDGKRFGTAAVENGAFVSKTNGDYVQFDAAKLAINKYYAITTEAFIRAGNKSNPSWTVFSYFGGGSGDNAFLTTIARNDNFGRTEYVGGATVVSPEIEDGNLHHLVSVLTNDTLAFYIDGELIGKSKNNKAISSINTTNAWLCKGGWPDATWNGSIFEYNIFEGTMSADSIAQRAMNFVGASNARLSGLSLSAGTLMPAFNPMVTEYAAVIPAGQTSVTINATPKYSISKVKGGGVVTLTNNVAVDTIKVTSLDSTTVTNYIVYVSIVDTTCFTPLFTTGNLVADPSMSDLTKFGGWGTKSVNVNPANIYCGATSGMIVRSGSIDAMLTGLLKPSTVYRVKAMVKTSVGAEFQLGVWGYAAGAGDINNKFKTEGAWVAIDFTFTTGATLGGTNGVFMNNWACAGADQDASQGFIDNWEIYEVATANTVQVKYVDATNAILKDARTFATTSPIGTLVFANAADKAEIVVGDQRYQFDEVSVDTIALVGGENIITLKFKNVTGVKDMFDGKVKVNVINGTLKVYLNVDKAADYSVEVLGVQGNILATQQDMEVAGQNELSFNLPTNGVYLVKISSGAKTAVFKVVK